MAEIPRTPLLEHDPEDSPVFLPGNLLEAARRQKGLPPVSAPEGCLLDFDGELVGHLVATGCKALISISSAGLIAANLAPPFFLLLFPRAGRRIGILGEKGVTSVSHGCPR